jgi:site-specific DNA recombinase
MKVFIYCRKSQDREDRQILSTDAQERLLTDYAKAHGFTVVDIFVENQSAYKIGRPLFNEMLRRIEEGESNVILTYHLTRLARNSFDGGRVIYMLDDQAIREIKTPDSTFTNSSDDKFMMQIHFAMAKKSSDDTSQFVKRDIESKLLKGEFPGTVPIGYLNIDRHGRISPKQHSPEKQILLAQLGRPLKREEIDPIDGALVRMVFEEAARGTGTLRSLQAFAFKVGLRTRTGKAKISHCVLQNMLTNPYFYGAIRYQGKIVTENVQHEALVSKALFERVQQSLGTRSKGRMRKHSFSFRGIMHCGICGCRITAEMQKGITYYHCTHKRGNCNQRKWSKEQLIAAQLFEKMVKLNFPETFVTHAMQKVRELYSQESRAFDVMRHKLQSEYNNCKHKIDALLQMKISPKNANGELLSEEEYMSQKNALKAELDLLEEQLGAQHQSGGTWLDDCERFLQFTQRLPEMLAEASMNGKREIMMLVCSNVILKDQEITVEYHEPFASMAKFPLAGKGREAGFEPERGLREAENPEMLHLWQSGPDVMIGL